jgi:hypothetical protein
MEKESTRIYRIIVLLLLLVAMPKAAWEQVDGPSGTPIACCAAAGDTFLKEKSSQGHNTFSLAANVRSLSTQAALFAVWFSASLIVRPAL